MIDDDKCSSRFRPRSDPVHSLFRGGHQHRRAPRSQGSRFRRRLTSLWSHRSKWRFLSGGSDGFMHRTCQNMDDLKSPSAQPVKNRAYLAQLKSSSPSLSCRQCQNIRCRHPACRVHQRPRHPNWQCDDADHTRQPPGRRLLLPSPADQDHPLFPFPLTPPTHWFVLLFTRVSIIVTVCWPRARSTWPKSFNRFCALPRGSYFNCRIGHPLLTSCTDSYTGLTFAVGWGLRSAFSSSSASTGWLPSTSPDYCVPVPVSSTRSSLHSARFQERLLTVPRTRTKTIGPCGFFHASPAVWNSLPDDVRDPELSIGCFRNKLKTFLFSQI